MPPPDGPTGAARLKALLSWTPAALFVFVPAILIWPALGSGVFLRGNDVIGGFYHLRGAIGRALAEGRLPVWDPHVMCGTPQLAALHGGVLYPLTWPAAILSPGVFWTSTVWIHLSLTGIFAFAWLARGLGLSRGAALLGSLLLMLSGFLTSHVFGGHIPHVSCVPWAVALLWRLERYLSGPTLRRGLFLAVPLTFMILAGFPQFVFVSGFAILGRLLSFVCEAGPERRSRVLFASRAALWLGLGGLMAAPQLLPTLELLPQIQRVAVNDFEFISRGGLAPINLLALLVPTFFGDDRVVPMWSHASIGDSVGFLGIAALALAAIGLGGDQRQRYWWAGTAALAVLLALGSHTLVFRVFAALVPGATLFREPGRYLFLYVLAMVPLTAAGFERLLKGDASLRRHTLVVAGVAGLLLLVAIGARANLRGPGYKEPGWWMSFYENEAMVVRTEQGVDVPASSEAAGAAANLASGSLLWAACCLALLVAGLAIRPGQAVALAMGGLLIGELWVFDARYYSPYPVEDAEWPPAFVSAVRNHPQAPFRIATVSPAQTPLVGRCQLAGIDHVGGYEPMMLRRYAELVNVARGREATSVVVAMSSARPGPLFDLLGARLWIVPGERQEPPGWRTFGQLPSAFVYENPHALPRAFLVGRSVVPPTDSGRLKVLAEPTFDGRSVAVLESPEDAWSAGPEFDGGTLQLAETRPGFYSLRSECATESILVLSEAFYPGWTAQVDGVPAPILRADHLLQAVRLTKGRHEVTFSYRSRYLGLGFAVALLALLPPLGLVWLEARKRRPKI